MTVVRGLQTLLRSLNMTTPKLSSKRKGPPPSVTSVIPNIDSDKADGHNMKKLALPYLPLIPSRIDSMFRKRSSFVADVEMRVDLPDLPSDAKLLKIPVDTDRLYAFCASALEQRTKPELYTEWDLGIPIEAIDPNAYALHPSAGNEMHPDDELLLSMARDCMKTSRAALSRRRDAAQQEFPVAKWFRKPEIMSTNVFSMTASKREALKSAKPNDGTSALPSDPNTIVQQIEESFVQHRGRPIHSKNPNLEAVSVLPIYPHHDLEKLKLSHVMFDRATFDPRRGETDNPAHRGLFWSAPDQPRVKDFYVRGKSSSSAYEWTARYSQTMPNAVPEGKDRLFFMMTPSAVMYGDLSTRESLLKITNVDLIPEEERMKIPTKIHLDLQ